MKTNTGFLPGKICLITGAGRGIGMEIAKRFWEEGAVVYANARKKDCLKEWAEKLNSKGNGTIIPIYFDLTNTDEIKKSVVRLRNEAGRIDVLVNNAGIIFNDTLGMISLEKTRKMFDVNVFGLLELTQFIATRLMMKQGNGSIVNLASIVGVEGNRGQIAYSASKGAVIALTKSMAKELAPYHIRVNAVAPGMIQTERLTAVMKDRYKKDASFVGFGRLGKPREIADGCLYFASELSSYTTGQVLVIGGGYDTASRSMFDIEFKEE